jgi:hypothetical protein
MFQRKQGRFRHRSNGRGPSRRDGHSQTRSRPNSFLNNSSRNNFRPSQSAEKLYEKYTTLAKEAISSGDKTLSENYFQHADHFLRVIEDKNKNLNQTKNNGNVEKIITSDKELPNTSTLDQENIIKEKE